MFLDKYLNRKAFTALLVGGILAIMIGAVLLVISYTVISAIFTTSAAAMTVNSTMNASLYGNLSNITAALNIAGISLIVVGISAIKTNCGVKISTWLSSLYAHRTWWGGRQAVIQT